MTRGLSEEIRPGQFSIISGFGAGDWMRSTACDCAPSTVKRPSAMLRQCAIGVGHRIRNSVPFALAGQSVPAAASLTHGNFATEWRSQSPDVLYIFLANVEKKAAPKRRR
jgi:hypothetical protein